MAAQLRVSAGGSATVSRPRRSPRRWSSSPPPRSPRRRRGWQASQPYAEEITEVLAALAGNANLDHPMLAPRGRGPPGRHPAGHQRPRPGRRLQRQRASGPAERARRAAPERGQAGRPVRHRPQGRGLLHVPQPADRGELDRLLRAADVRRRPEVGETLIRRSSPARTTWRRSSRGADGVPASTSCTSCHTQFRSLHDPAAGGAAARPPMQVDETDETSDGAAAGVRVRAGPGRTARRTAAEVHQHPHLRRVDRFGGGRVGGAPAGDEVGHATTPTR